MNNLTNLSYGEDKRKQLLASFGKTDVDFGNIEKGEGGEGSRGGKVIGHTKSGKPIYSGSHESHSNYTVEDHKDAASKHYQQATHHMEMSEDFGEMINKTKPGSEAEKTYMKSQNEHEDARIHHASMYHYHDSQAKKKAKDEKMKDSTKILAEEPKHLATTRSGKKIMSNFENKEHEFYTKNDHIDAYKEHNRIGSMRGMNGDKEGKQYHFAEAEKHKKVADKIEADNEKFKKSGNNKVEKAFEDLMSAGEITDPVEKSFDNLIKAEFSEKDRKKLAGKGEARKDGSFPIRNAEDLHNAISDYGRSNDPEAAKKWIKKRAKELDLESELPESWKKD